MRSAFFYSIALASLIPPSITCAQDVEQEKIEKLVYQSWGEIYWECAGKSVEVRTQLDEYEFGRNKYEYQARGGQIEHLARELKTEIIINAKVYPMTLDVVYHEKDGKKSVHPCIISVDDERMIWVTPSFKSPTVPYREDGKYENRPTTFKVDQKNKHEKHIMVPIKR